MHSWLIAVQTRDICDAQAQFLPARMPQAMIGLIVDEKPGNGRRNDGAAGAISDLSPSSALIYFDRVSRIYARGHVQALRGVSLRLEHEDYVAITGPSGSGKSTLLYLASGMDRPDAGSVFFDGVSREKPAEWTRLRATRIGFVFQSFQLIASLTAAENVELPMLGVIAGERKRRARAAELLERVGLGHRKLHRIGELSGGEAQRVAIARAMANSPTVILADEPTGNLDSQTANQVLNLLEDLHMREKVTLVMVTHDATNAGRAKRIIHIRDGQLVGDERRKEPA